MKKLINDKMKVYRNARIFALERDKFSCFRNSSETNFLQKDPYVVHETQPNTVVIKLYNRRKELIGIDVKEIEKKSVKIVCNTKKKRITVIIEEDGKCFHGCSTCSKHDKYDAQTGYEIAHYRAKIKAMQSKLHNLTQ